MFWEDFGLIEPNKRVLVVDDMFENRLVLKSRLGQMGYIADEASEGREAIEFVLKFSYSHIFMDLNMPGMDGFEAVRIIRDMERVNRKSRQVISAVTTYNSKEIKLRCESLGFDHFINKPVSSEHLQHVLGLKPVGNTHVNY